MGTQRNGARTLLDLMAKACKLTHLPGFITGLNQILGSDEAASFYALWSPTCQFVEGLIAADNFYNQIDYTEETSGSEDISGA